MPQNSGLLSQMDRLSLQSPLRLLSVFVFYLLQAHSCRGQSQLIGPPQPIVARVGDDIILPCHLKPAVDVVAMTLEWKRPDLASEFVLVWRDGQDFELTKNPSYKERTSLFIDELRRGNISLKLSKVQLSDQGTYECFIPDLNKQSSVKLFVGESELIGSPQQIVATVGDDIILPCHLEPAVDVAARTLEWTRPDLNHRSVHMWRDGQDIIHVEDPSYRGRTSLFTDELKRGNISLKLSKVKPSDEGRYKCGIPDMNTHSFIELVVGAVSYPVFTLAGIDEATRGVMLDCRSEGWYPEPEVLWLDGEGNLLSAGPPETVRGPDDLYTVSSRVTVEKRHSNSFTCRVQQKNTNQTRETHIQVPDDFFKIQSSSVPVITGLAVSLAVCIVFILLLLFVVWKWRLNRIKKKRSHRDQTDKGEKKNHSKTNKSEDQCVTEEREREREQLMTHETVEMEVLKGNEQKKSKHLERSRAAPVFSSSSGFKWPLVSRQKFQDEQQRVQILEEELQTKNKEMKDKEQAAEAQMKKTNEEINQLKGEISDLQQKHDEEVKQLTDKWQKKLHDETTKREEAEKEVEKLKKEVENLKKEVENLKKEVENLKKEVENLKKEVETKLEDKLQEADAQMKKSNEEMKRKDEEISQLKREIWDKKQKHDEEVKQLMTKNPEWQKKLHDETTKREEAEKEVEKLKKEVETKMKEKQQAADAEMKKTNEDLKKTKHQLKIKDEEMDLLKRNIWDLQQKHDGEVKQLMTKFEMKLQEETTKMKEAEKEVENLKKEMEDESSSSSQSSNTEPFIVVEVNQKGKYIRLINKSNQDQPLGDWRLETQVNRKIITYTFEKSFKLKSGSTVSMSGPGCVQQYDLWLKDLAPWSSGDNLKFTLISDTYVRHQLGSYPMN